MTLGRAIEREPGKTKLGDGGGAGGCHDPPVDVEVDVEVREKPETEAESPGGSWGLRKELGEEVECNEVGVPGKIRCGSLFSLFIGDRATRPCGGTD